jgi:hypothetical protein
MKTFTFYPAKKSIFGAPQCYHQILISVRLAMVTLPKSSSENYKGKKFKIAGWGLNNTISDGTVKIMFYDNIGGHLNTY